MLVTECNGCGSCCDPVTLSVSQDDVRRLLPYQVGARTRQWVLEELRPLSRREGLERAPWLKGRQTMQIGPDGKPDFTPSHFYECTNLDPVTRQCNRYDDRPPVCRNFPHDGQARINPGATLAPWCSFRADIGQEVEPQPDWQAVELTRKKDRP